MTQLMTHPEITERDEERWQAVLERDVESAP